MSNIIDSIQLSGVTYTLSAQTSGGDVSSAITSGDTNAVAGGAVYDKFDEVEQVTAAALNVLNESLSGKQDTLSAGTNITIVDNVISASGGGGGNPTVELTQAQYDALVTAGTVSADTYYIITDAQAGDLTQYWTSAQTNSAITQAVSGKQDTLSAGTNITIVDNVISASGGGKAIEAGRGITVTTGATADTVSFNLPISGGTGSRSIREGFSTVASGNDSHAEGRLSNATGSSSHAEGEATFANGKASHTEGGMSQANGDYSHAEGFYTIAKNKSEHASGEYNVSNTGSTTADKTLFSVGNGTADNARHNAFEIRQDGSIFITSGGTDIKLQDHLGGTVDQTIISGSTNAVAGGAVYDKFDEVEQVTAAGLNALNDKFGGLKLVKLSQAEYNALATKDPSTLYVIVN